jgi:molybdate transport system substrate-binding protein
LIRRVLLLLAFAPAALGVELRVSAAASLGDALREVGANYEKRSGDRVVFNFGPSSTLARQIAEGAPADAFLSADELQMDRVAVTKRRVLLSNTLAIVGVRKPTDLAAKRIRRVALANPASVPAGVYAKEYLTRLRLWPAVAPKVIPTENVRAALAAFEAGNVDAAIVYSTDLRAAKTIRVVFHVPRADGPKISYPAAVLRDAKEPAAARRFLDYLASPAAAAVFRRHGFLIP